MMSSKRPSSAVIGQESASKKLRVIRSIRSHRTFLDKYCDYSFHFGRSTEAEKCDSSGIQSLDSIPFDAKPWPPLPSAEVVAEFLRGCCLQLAVPHSWVLRTTDDERPKYLFVYELLSAVAQLQVWLPQGGRGTHNQRSVSPLLAPLFYRCH